MKLRGLVALGLLLVAAFIERIAYFGAHTFLGVHLHEQGDTYASIGTTLALLQGFVLLGTLAGGAAAFGVGPRITAAGGLFIAAAGYLGAAMGAPVVGGAAVVSLGTGIMHPCFIVAAAEVLAWDDASPDAPAPHRFAAVAAYAAALSLVTSIGGFLGPWQSGSLRSSGSWGLVYGVAGAETLLAAMVAGGAALLGLLGRATARAPGDAGPYRAAPPPGPPPAPVTTTVRGLSILLAAEAFFAVGANGVSTPYHLLRDSTAADAARLFAVNPAAMALASIFVLVFLVVAANKMWSLPPLYLYGAGLVVFGFGLVLIAGGKSVAPYVLGAVLTGIGESAVYAIPIAYAASVVRGRAANLVVAGWSSVLLLVTNISSAVAYVELLRLSLLTLSASLTMLAGTAILATARRFHRTFFHPAASPQSSPATAVRGMARP
jgi:hypothetical protein